MSLRKEIEPPKTGPQSYVSQLFKCDAKGPYWEESRKAGQASAILLLRNNYGLQGIRGDKKFTYVPRKKGNEEEKKDDKEEKIIEGQIILRSNSAEEARAYLLSKRKELGTVFGTILPKKPEEQETFWNELAQSLKP